jgi:GST-like protein
MPDAHVQLFTFGTPNGIKPAIMLEECGIPYDVICIDITKGEQHAPEFLRISPNNKIPVIVDPDGPGARPITVFESGAILQYLGRKTGRFYPGEERVRTTVEEWLFWQMASLGPMGAQAHHFLKYAKEKVPYAMKRYADEMHRLYGVMDARLGGRDYLADAYSIADMACYGWIRRWKDQGVDIAEFPQVKNWLQRLEVRPAVERARAGVGIA